MTNQESLMSEYRIIKMSSLFAIDRKYGKLIMKRPKRRIENGSRENAVLKRILKLTGGDDHHTVVSLLFFLYILRAHIIHLHRHFTWLEKRIEVSSISSTTGSQLYNLIEYESIYNPTII